MRPPDNWLLHLRTRDNGLCEDRKLNLLVTGGAGYIGSVIAGQLAASSHRVTIYDNLSKGHRPAVPNSAELVIGDLADRDRLAHVFEGGKFDAVLHFAASIEAGESMLAPEKFFRNNSANTLNLLECMLVAGTRKFVFSSTAALYGNAHDKPIAEDDLYDPTNPYGESKLMVEKMLGWFHRIHGLRYASLRYFNAAGADGHHRGEAHNPETHLIPRVLQVALGQAESVSIFGANYKTPDGTCVRDYIHVSDLASAHLLALDALQDSDRPLIYNLGNGTGFSVREVIQAARAVTGRDIKSVDREVRPGDPSALIASSEKIRRELGWMAKIPKLENIVASAWDWHRLHPHGYSESGDEDHPEPVGAATPSAGSA